jgi:GNAT superfamily N-acetyltransferase
MLQEIRSGKEMKLTVPPNTPEPPAPPPFVELALTIAERAQIEVQLAACFGLTAEAARTWVETTARSGACFGRLSGGRVAASFTAEALPLARGDERLAAVMVQSCYVHPDFRGRGYGLERADIAALRRRFAADAVVLTLFDDGLVPYWRRRGFEVVQRAQEIDLSEYVRRAQEAFSPAPDERAVADKLAEVAADGAQVTETDGLVLVCYPGDDAVQELIVRDPRRAAKSVAAAADLATVAPAAEPDALRVRLKTVMASPGDLELVCAIDL